MESNGPCGISPASWREPAHPEGTLGAGKERHEASNSLEVSIDFGTLFTILFRKAHYSHLDDLLGRSLFRGLHVGGRWRRTC
jgi:hypothetical protein